MKRALAIAGVLVMAGVGTILLPQLATGAPIGSGSAVSPAGVSSRPISAPRFTATAATGNNGFAISTNGARVDFGAGASDYASSDGTTVTFAGPLAVTGAFTATSFSSSAASGSNGFGILTNGARIDFGAGASDYVSSDGTTVTYAGPLASASTVAGTTHTGTAAGGSNAFAVSTNGARVDFGAGASDYASSDGTTVTYAGPLATASTMTCTGLTMAGALSGATTGAFSGAITSSVASPNRALEVVSGAKVCLNGSTCTKYAADDGTWFHVYPHFLSEGDVGTYNGLMYTNGNNTPLRIRGNATNGGSAINVKLGGFTTLSTDGAYNVVIYSDSETTARVGFPYQGGIQLGMTDTAEPTCDAAHRGTIHYDQGAGGVADTLRVCRKDAADAYAWTALY